MTRVLLPILAAVAGPVLIVLLYRVLVELAGVGTNDVAGWLVVMLGMTASLPLALLVHDLRRKP